MSRIKYFYICNLYLRSSIYYLASEYILQILFFLNPYLTIIYRVFFSTTKKTTPIIYNPKKGCSSKRPND